MYIDIEPSLGNPTADEKGSWKIVIRHEKGSSHINDGATKAEATTKAEAESEKRGIPLSWGLKFDAWEVRWYVRSPEFEIGVPPVAYIVMTPEMEKLEFYSWFTGKAAMDGVGGVAES